MHTIHGSQICHSGNKNVKASNEIKGCFLSGSQSALLEDEMKVMIRAVQENWRHASKTSRWCNTQKLSL